MFKKVLNKIGGGIVGFFAGILIGPFAAAGKAISILGEEEEGRRSGHFRGRRTATGPLLMLILFFAGGFVYGPIRAAILGVIEGVHKSLLKNISLEMFTYNPFYKDITIKESAAKIPEDACLSHRTFCNAGLLNPSQNTTVENKSEPSVIAVATEAAQKTSPRFFGKAETNVPTSAVSGPVTSNVSTRPVHR